MVKKTIKKHDFISGSPVLDENITYGDYVLSLEEPSITNNIILTQPDGNEIFNISDTGVYYRDQPLATEDWVRQFVREIMGEY